VKTIPLTVLAHEGPGARAYVSMMAEAGFRPSAIIVMVASHGEFSGDGKKIGRLLPRFWRLKYASRVQELRRMYWPRRIRRQHPDLYASIAAGLSSIVDDSKRILDSISGPFRYEDYSDDVSRVMVRDYRDPHIARSLAGVLPAPVLFTGGGILSSDLIQLGPKFVHVHPGNLPNVRGADGLLWSTLVRGRPGAACFYMNAGIDTGEIIKTTDSPIVKFSVTDSKRPDDRTLYQALFSFYDPLMRAKFFGDVLSTYEGELPGSGVAQSTDEGITYHFMHDELRQLALRQIFVSEGA
jgi:hypothetical protein